MKETYFESLHLSKPKLVEAIEAGDFDE